MQLLRNFPAGRAVVTYEKEDRPRRSRFVSRKVAHDFGPARGGVLFNGARQEPVQLSFSAPVHRVDIGESAARNFVTRAKEYSHLAALEVLLEPSGKDLRLKVLRILV